MAPAWQALQHPRQQALRPHTWRWATHRKPWLSKAVEQALMLGTRRKALAPPAAGRAGEPAGQSHTTAAGSGLRHPGASCNPAQQPRRAPESGSRKSWPPQTSEAMLPGSTARSLQPLAGRSHLAEAGRGQDALVHQHGAFGRLRGGAWRAGWRPRRAGACAHRCVTAPLAVRRSSWLVAASTRNRSPADSPRATTAACTAPGSAFQPPAAAPVTVAE